MSPLPGTKHYKKISIPVKGYNRYDKKAKRWIKVRSHTRKQKVRDYYYFNRVVKKQISRSEWAHLSEKYPNIIGLSDEGIDAFIKATSYNKKEEEVIKEYINHIKCYNQDDIRAISKKTFDKFDKRMKKRYAEGKLPNENPYLNDTTIFITSPRGGFDVLSDFGYANSLKKKNFPYDLERYKYSTPATLKAESLPYGSSIQDVNDIVFIDDIYMSGEQCGKTFFELDKKLRELNIPKEQRPRIHYMSIAGNKHTSQGKAKWDTFTVGEKFNFRREGKQFEGVSAVVFPFSIPDGSRHHIARRLYSHQKRFEHRK